MPREETGGQLLDLPLQVILVSFGSGQEWELTGEIMQGGLPLSQHCDRLSAHVLRLLSPYVPCLRSRIDSDAEH